MSYCALDEAFLGPPNGPPPVKHRKHRRTKDVPPMLPDVPVEQKDDLLEGSPAAPVNRLEATQSDSFFPLPGKDSWESAFMMNSDFTKTLQRPDNSVPVADKPTLWREIPEQPLAPSVISDVNRRLDALTKQLENLGTPTAAQGTAELFLFVAIGLLLLLAIDTLLRFASSMATTKQAGGRRGFGRTRFR
jgi:hypothetical protein